MRQLKRILPFAGSIGLLVLLLVQVHPSQIVALLDHASLPWLAVGLACYLATNVVRAYRTAGLLAIEGWLAPLRLLPDMVLVSLFNNTLPSRSGELSFPYLMHERHGVTLGESTAALLLMRVLDYLAVALLFLAVIALEAHHLAASSLRIAAAAAVVLFFSAALLAAMPWGGARMVCFAGQFAEHWSLASRKPWAWVLVSLDKAVQALERMRNGKTVAITGSESVLGWIGTFAWFAAFMRAVGHPQTFLLIILGATFAILAKAVPLISIGGLGAHEAGWALGFGLIGMAPADAVASGLAVNVLTLAASGLCGTVGLVFISLRRRRLSPRPLPVNPPGAAGPIAHGQGH